MKKAVLREYLKARGLKPELKADEKAGTVKVKTVKKKVKGEK